MDNAAAAHSALLEYLARAEDFIGELFPLAALAGADTDAVFVSPALTVDFLDGGGSVLARRTGSSDRSPHRLKQLPREYVKAAVHMRLTLDAVADQVTGEEAIQLAGFYGSERSVAGAWRWTGPTNRCSVRLPYLLTRECEAEVEFAAVGRNTAPGHYSLAVNGTAAPHQLVAQGGRTLLTATVTPCSDPPKTLTIELRVKHLFTPGAGDDRSLGVCVRKLTLTTRLRPAESGSIR